VFAWMDDSEGSCELVVSKPEDDEEAADSFSVDWQTVPRLVHPMGGHLPEKRMLKKCQQLESMAREVVRIVKGHPLGSAWSPVIVDFCSGGGHLGILVAHLIPNATVCLVENKEESLRRAIERVQLLELSNCRFFQCNLDYFCGSFDLGVSLHACGVATDLVLKSCLDRSASFVSCPCCYGAVRENHVLEYPKSNAFKKMNWKFKDYLIVGHTADQTHATSAKDLQGRRAMDIIDSDRCREAEESGRYEAVELKTLRPPECTPKNNIIVGVRKEHTKK
jgi:hypothetical protein